MALFVRVWVKMKITIVRHGETEGNKHKIIQGHFNGKLTKEGEKQAKKVGKRLKKEKFEHIFSSDLSRALDTAKEITKHHPNASFKQEKELRERFHGKIEGKPFPKEWEKIRWDTNFMAKNNLETPEELLKRADKFIKKLVKSHYGKNVLLVGHARINNAIITTLLKKSKKYFKSLGRTGNTSVTVFEFNDKKFPVLKLLDDVSHLRKKI